MLDAAEAARRTWRARSDDADAGGEGLGGTLRITSVPAFGQAVLGPLLAGFQALHPALRIELRFTSRRVDLPREDIDVAFRLTDRPPADCVAQPVLPFVVRAYAAPDPAGLRWPLPGPAALAGERCLLFGGIGGVDDALTLRWQRDADGERAEVTLQPAMVGDDLGSLQSVARAGGGVVLAPDFCAREDLARGTLAEVLPGWRLPVAEGSTVMALTLPWTVAPASARALVQHVRAALADRTGGAGN
ncbi:MAG: substrate binding domain-containing protein [Rubrivivax sp.]|nr:substrate binding domain-containing protein [Rubrivivax sp.]